jgi:hypothetical protein
MEVAGQGTLAVVGPVEMCDNAPSVVHISTGHVPTSLITSRGVALT